MAVILCRDAACRVSGRGDSLGILELNILRGPRRGKPRLYTTFSSRLGGGGRVVRIQKPVLGVVIDVVSNRIHGDV